MLQIWYSNERKSSGRQKTGLLVRNKMSEIQTSLGLILPTKNLRSKFFWKYLKILVASSHELINMTELRLEHDQKNYGEP